MKFDLETIFDLVPGNVFWKGKDGKYLGCNKSQANQLHLKSPKDIIGLTLFDLLPEHIATIIEKNDNYVMRSGKEYVIEEQGYNEFGHLSMYLSRKLPLFDEQGNVGGLLGISIHAEKTFDLEKIIALMPGNIFWKDKDGRYLGCNNNVAKLLNLNERHDIVGRTDREILPEHVASLLTKNDSEVIKSGKEFVAEETGYDIAGNPATFLSSKIPFFNERQEVVGLLGISMDITFRKKYEEELRSLKEKAEAANKAKSEFIANISHDLRTPMTGIIGFTDILKFKETDPEKIEMLELLESSGRRLLDLLNEIVNVVEVEEKQDVNSETFNIRDLIEDNSQLLMPAIEMKKLNYLVEMDELVPYNLVGDRKRIAQVLLNLTGNAVKFTEKGFIKVTVKTLSAIKKGKIKIQIAVQDTGIGIDKIYFDKIFEKFSYLNLGNKEKYPGSGLGLWLVKKIIDNLGGKIKVESTLGKGTTFTIELDFQVI